MEFTDLEKHRDLRHQFEKETGAHPFADQRYIQWLEQKLVKESDSLPCVSDRREVINIQINHKQIIKAVCNYFKITESDLKSKRRDSVLTYPRHLSWMMMRHNEYTTKEIGRIFERDHSTVVQMTNELNHFKASRLKEDYDNICKLINQLEDATNAAHLKSHVNKVSVFERALEMEKNAHQNLITKFIKNRDQTRPLIFENGFVKGFEEGLKYSEEFYKKLKTTSMDEEDFTREYLQEKSSQYFESVGKKNI